MDSKRAIVGVLAGLVICGPAAAQGVAALASISNQDAVQGLKDALVDRKSTRLNSSHRL